MDENKNENDKSQETEVSLPGAGRTDQTILEVFNSNLVSASGNTVGANESVQLTPPLIEQSEHIEDDRTHQQSIDESTTNESKPIETSSASVEGAAAVINTGNINSATQQRQQQVQATEDITVINPEVLVADTKFESDDVSNSESNRQEVINDDFSKKAKEENNSKVLDIESHLIETFENYSVSESDNSGVSVKEVPPAKEELSKPSAIESEDSLKTVIEIEPRTPVLHKTIEKNINTVPHESKVEFSAENSDKNLIDSETNLESTQTSNLVSNKNSGDEVLNFPTVPIESQTQEKSEYKTEKSDEVPVSPHIEEEKKNLSPEEFKKEEIHRLFNSIQISEPGKQTKPVDPHIEEKRKIESKLQSELINSEGPTKETSEVKQADTVSNSELKSPALLRLIEKSLGISSNTEKEIQDREKTAEITQTGPPKQFTKTSESGKEVTIETVQNTEVQETNSNIPEEIVNETDEKLGINGLGVASLEEEEAKKSFLESIPQLEESSSASTSIYRQYQSLREYLNRKEASPPPVPLQTYRWEDLRRAKEKGGYPWTHLYKRPLGPDEEPEIVLLLRKSQELRLPSESPRSLKKVRIHDQVLVKETERYISDLSDAEDVTETEEDTKSARSETTSISESEDKPSKLNKIKGILKRNRPPKLNISSTKENGEINGNKSEHSPKRPKCCHPIMDKIKTMADKQLKKRHIKKVPLKKDERIILMDEQKILKLKLSPKAERSEIPHFIEKRDSDEILEDDRMEIVELDESPSKVRKRREQLAMKDDSLTSVLVPDEIIEIPQVQVDESSKPEDAPQPTPEPIVSEVLEEELKVKKGSPPQKSPRKKKEHVYEDIDDSLGSKIDEILEEAVVTALKQSLVTQDQTAVQDLAVKPKLEEMGSSEETEERQMTHLAPISSIDSTSSEEERKQHLAPLAEESDQGEQADSVALQNETFEVLRIVEDHEREELNPSNETAEIKSALKREPSPSTSDKKVTFSHVEDESEPHKEDIELPEQFQPPPNRWSKTSDHEYEPIGAPSEEQTQDEPSKPETETPTPLSVQPIPTVQVSEPMEIDHEIPKTNVRSIQREIETTEYKSPEGSVIIKEIQRDIEERYFSSATTTPRTESRTDSRTDYVHTSQVDSSAIEELPLKAESRKKSFMANAQDKGKKVQANLRSQAVKIRTKIRGIKKPPTGSPKKERKRFRTPEFSKMKMPEMKFKAPDMSKFKTPEFKKFEFKRPEFTKFNKPDMSKFKMPEKLSSLKLKRSRSLKESEVTGETTSIPTPETSSTSPKKMFEFNFGTYPRALRKKKEKSIMVADDIPSSETPPSFESATIPRGARDKGPVGSRWADKFSEVSYGDSESGKYQRYESSEPESIEPRESSLERKIRENLDRVAKEDAEFGILQTKEQKQFAEFDEENRAIHEISKIRETEFKQRRPMVHQDSDLVSEESKEIGWSEKDIIRNKLLKQTNVENENFASEEGLTGSATNTNLETQSTGSSSALRQKGVIEEIDDDEFFLRKRGISQDNIEIRQYISTAIREGFDTPINALAKLGNSHEYYPDEMVISDERMDYGYDVPPPKPRRVKRYNNSDHNTGSAEVSQEFDIEQKDNYDDNISLPQTGSDYFKQLPPNRPLRKSKKQYSEDSQEVPDAEDIPYFDDEQEFFKRIGELNNLGQSNLTKTSYDQDIKVIDQIKGEPPKAPKRRKKQLRESAERDSYLNGFAGRSVSNSYLPNGNQFEELAVYRTEHEYVIPLAQPEQFTPLPTPPRRSTSRITDDDRTSHGADSLIFNDDDNNFKVDIKENNGYATVKKEPPPRPPAPVRRKRSPNPFEQRFSTMPHLRKDSPLPQRPKRNYSTIGPARPPRRRSSASIGDIKKDFTASDATQYEELDVNIEDFERMESPKHLQSGDVINKMKDRPLPPPPRPPRDGKKHKYNTDLDDDKDGGGEKIITDLQQNGDYEIEKPMEKCIEVEASTQTDPLPDDFVCEEFEITDDMKIIEPRRPKTLEDILKEEQEAEFERAKQLADEENLARGLQRFRESNQRSFSERSKGSTADRSKTSLSRPTTPSAILIERRVPTPLPYLDQTMLEASLTVQPVDDDEIVEPIESEPAMSEIKSERSEEKSEGEPEDRFEEQALTSDAGSQFQEEEERLKDDIIYKLDLSKHENEEYKPKYSDETDFALESNLEKRTTTQNQSVLKQDISAEETALQEETQSEPESPPQPPPRRRSSAALTAEQMPEVVSEPPPPATSTQLIPISELSPTPVQAVAPNRLAVADLEVERLSVHALQAGQITVSQLHGSLISADELDCKSGNLVVRNLELPHGLIEEIVERVRSSERPQSQAQTQTVEVEERKSPTTPSSLEEPPARPPPPPQHQIFPSEYMQYSVPPPSFYQLRPPTDEDIVQPIQPHRRRRHYRRRDSSSEEESYRERRRSRQGTRSPEPTIVELGGQLLNACGTSVVRTMNQILNYLRAAEKEGTQRSNISTAIVILILATLGFLLLGISGKNIHHHHWDFFNLPGNDGRGSRN